MKVQLNLILGHRAVIREHKTPEGFTHDWEVFVRCDQGPIEAFVDRVIFNIHESFPKPKRVVKEPPFVVKESGYAGFMVDIEVLFKTKDEPKRADFKYDLYLQSDGGPINPSRKEKLIFNFPSEEFAKKLIKAGGIVTDKQSPSSSSGSSSAPYVSSNSGGGKSSKHSVANTGAKSSPKNSFENLFGTPIKRSGPSLITSTSSSAGSSAIAGPSKDIKASKPGKGGGKPDKVFEMVPIKTEKVSSKGQKSSSSSLENSPAESIVSKASSHKPSKSSTKSAKAVGKNMLPPDSPLVPKKSKKSELFDHSSNDEKEKKRKSDKSKKKSKHSREAKLDPVVIKKEKVSPPQPTLSPISSSSTPSPSSSQTSASLANSEDDSDSGSSKMIPAISSTSSSRSRKRSSHSQSQSPTSIDSPTSSSSASSIPQTKRRKQASPSPGPPMEEPSSSRSSRKEKKKSKSKKSSRSEARKEKRIAAITSPADRDRRNYVISAPAEPSTSTSSKSRKSSKKSKKSSERVKVFEDSLSSSSASESVSSDSPMSSSPAENGGYIGNGGCSTPTFNHASIAGSITAEMKLLKELHAKIHALEDPLMLQNIVDIVEGCGKDQWSIDSGKTFDFDLCKLSSTAIQKLQKAIFFN